MNSHKGDSICSPPPINAEITTALTSLALPTEPKHTIKRHNLGLVGNYIIHSRLVDITTATESSVSDNYTIRISNNPLKRHILGAPANGIADEFEATDSNEKQSR